MKRFLKILLTAATVIAILVLTQVFIFPIQRADLGISATEAEQCSLPKAIPAFQDYNIYPKPDGSKRADPELVSTVFLPYAVASLNAYRGNKTFLLSRYDPTWKSVDEKAIGEPTTWNGFDRAVYEREASDGVEILVAIRGSDKFNPFKGHFIGTFDWLFGNLSYITQWLAVDQYRSARKTFQDVRAWAQRTHPDKKVFYTVTGHSLGAGLSRHVARAFPCVRAVAFNSSSVTNEFRLANPFKTSQLVLINEDDDPLTKYCNSTSTFFGFKKDEFANVYANANFVLKADKDQHSMDKYSAGMARGALCCIQRDRIYRKKNPNCSCDRTVLAAKKQVEELFCGEHGRRTTDEACDFTGEKAATDPQCVAPPHTCNE